VSKFDCPLFSLVKFRPGNDFIRMGHIGTALYKGALRPGQVKWSFWNAGLKPTEGLEKKLVDKKTGEPSEYLIRLRPGDFVGS
jgi:hypothetical protein